MPEIVFDRVLSQGANAVEPDGTPYYEYGRVRILVDGLPYELTVGKDSTPEQEVTRWVQAVYGQVWPPPDPDGAALLVLAGVDPATWTNAQLRDALVRLIRIELRKRRL